MKYAIKALIALAILFSACMLVQAQDDMEGGKDHPMLTRMTGFYITNYEEYDYDSASFYNSKDNEIVVEGKKYVISYQIKDDATSPGSLNIMKNYTNAIQKIGGTILYQTSDYAYMKVVKGGAETWISLWVQYDGGAYELVIIEKKALEQQIVADPKAMGDDIMATGHVAVYGIYFDTGKADIKPESEATLKAIAQMLKNNPTLKVYVVGHTDSDGKLDYNMDLSAKRADSVAKALSSQYGIDAARLKSKGVGPLCPVASNKTDDGKAKNRRVELVEM